MFFVYDPRCVLVVEKRALVKLVALVLITIAKLLEYHARQRCNGVAAGSMIMVASD